MLHRINCVVGLIKILKSLKLLYADQVLLKMDEYSTCPLDSMEYQRTAMKGRQNLWDVGMTWWTMFTILTIKKLGGYFWRKFIWLRTQSPRSSRGNVATKQRFPQMAGIFWVTERNDFLRPYVPFKWLALLLRIREMQSLMSRHCDRLSDLRLPVVLLGSFSHMTSYYTNLGGKDHLLLTNQTVIRRCVVCPIYRFIWIQQALNK